VCQRLEQPKRRLDGFTLGGQNVGTTTGWASEHQKEPAPKAEYWVNVRADAKDWNFSDLVADFGEQWDMKSGPNMNGRVDVNHADAWAIYIADLGAGLSARDVLMGSVVLHFKGRKCA